MSKLENDSVDTFLAHYGVRGMKWGVRRSAERTKVQVSSNKGRIVTKGGTGQKAHDDAIRAAIAGQKAKKSGTAALSNKEMKALIERMNLEKQYSQMIPPSKKKRTAKFASKLVSDVLLNAGKQLATEATKNALSSQLEEQFGIAIKNNKK